MLKPQVTCKRENTIALQANECSGSLTVPCNVLKTPQKIINLPTLRDAYAIWKQNMTSKSCKCHSLMHSSLTECLGHSAAAAEQASSRCSGMSGTSERSHLLPPANNQCQPCGLSRLQNASSMAQHEGIGSWACLPNELKLGVSSILTDGFKAKF